MFCERYYKRFPVRVKIIAYNAIIIFCHLVEFAIFAVCNFFRLFSIAIFNIPISHNCLVFDYAYKVTTFFRKYKFFLIFFVLWCGSWYGSTDIGNFFCMLVFLPFPVVFRVRWCVFSLCRLWSPDNHTHAHTYARTHIRARGFLDYKFLDITAIFSLRRNF